LDLHREKLSKRYNYGKDLKIWEFAFPRNKALFDKKAKRIFIPCKERISKKRYFRFTLANENVFPLQDVTGILQKSNCRESIEYVLAFLNNERVFNWLIYNGIVKGDIVEFSEAPLASIPYRPINWNDDTEVLIHNDIVNNVKAYISSKEDIYIDQINNNFNMLLDGKS
ncbi:MAG: restriction endonuclease, partial [Rikenellaceae bacterium]